MAGNQVILKYQGWQNSAATRGFRVPAGVSLVNELEDIVHTLNLLLHQSHHLHLLFPILQDPQLLLPIQEVINFPSINLKEAGMDGEVLGSIGRVRLQGKDVSSCKL